MKGAVLTVRGAPSDDMYPNIRAALGIINDMDDDAKRVGRLALQEINDAEKYIDDIRYRAVIGARLFDKLQQASYNSIKGWNQVQPIVDWYNSEVNGEPEVPLPKLNDCKRIGDETLIEARLRLAATDD